MQHTTLIAGLLARNANHSLLCHCPTTEWSDCLINSLCGSPSVFAYNQNSLK